MSSSPGEIIEVRAGVSFQSNIYMSDIELGWIATGAFMDRDVEVDALCLVIALEQNPNLQHVLAALVLSDVALGWVYVENGTRIFRDVLAG